MTREIGHVTGLRAGLSPSRIASKGSTGSRTALRSTAANTFLELDAIAVVDLERFVQVCQPGARLRDRAGMDVYVGNHRPPPGAAGHRAHSPRPVQRRQRESPPPLEAAPGIRRPASLHGWQRPVRAHPVGLADAALRHPARHPGSAFFMRGTTNRSKPAKSPSGAVMTRHTLAARLPGHRDGRRAFHRLASCREQTADRDGKIRLLESSRQLPAQ